MRVTGLWQLPNGRGWLWGKLGLALPGGALLSKSLIFCWWEGAGTIQCVPSLWFGLRPHHGRRNGGNGDLLQKDLLPAHHSSQDCCSQCPWPHGRPLSTHASAGDSWTLTGMFGSVSCKATAPFSWVWVHTRFCLCPPSVRFPSPVEFL